MTSSLRPCLYCENPTNPHTREHILQQGFGTNWVLKEDVCSECNTQKFSHLDSELLRFAHAYIYMDHPDRLSRRTILQEGHKLWFDDQAGLWISLQVRQDGKRADTVGEPRDKFSLYYYEVLSRLDQNKQYYLHNRSVCLL